MHKHFSRQSLHAFGLAVFIVGAFYASVPSVNAALADVPWAYMPQSTLAAAGAFYSVNFIPAAEQYLVLVDGVGEVQAEAYSAPGRGVLTAATVAGETPPMAAVARWYLDLSGTVDIRLTPQ